MSAINMKKIHIVLVILLSAFLNSCSNEKDSKKTSVTDSADEFVSDSFVVKIEHVYGEFDLCEPEPSLYPILDAVVNSAYCCPKLKNNGLMYSLWIHKDEDSLTRVGIEVSEQKRVYCLSIDRIFTYKGLIFNANADKQYKDLFKNTGLKVKYLCMKENILMGDYNDGMVAYWEFVIKENQAQCINYYYCDKSWTDEKYYKIERVVQ